MSFLKNAFYGVITLLVCSVLCANVKSSDWPLASDNNWRDTDDVSGMIWDKEYQDLHVPPLEVCIAFPCFSPNCTATIGKMNIDMMFQSGLREAGYEHLNFDDCWAYHSYRNTPGTDTYEIIQYATQFGLTSGSWVIRGRESCGGTFGKRPIHYKHGPVTSDYNNNRLTDDLCWMTFYRRFEVGQALDGLEESGVLGNGRPRPYVPTLARRNNTEEWWPREMYERDDQVGHPHLIPSNWPTPCGRDCEGLAPQPPAYTGP